MKSSVLGVIVDGPCKAKLFNPPALYAAT